MITNDTGAVVYSAAHGPYGAIEKTWASSYDPALKGFQHGGSRAAVFRIS